MEKLYYVYILASRSRTLYTGITNNVIRRTAEHRESARGFTAKYRIHRLVHYEIFHDVRAAIAREKAIKEWTRAKKIALIQKENLTWEDRLGDLFPAFPKKEKADSSLRSE